MSTTLTHRFESSPAMLLAGLRRDQPFESLHQNIPLQWQAFTQNILNSGLLNAHLIQPEAHAPITYGVICGSTDSHMEYLCAIEVASFDGLPADIGRVILSAQDYVVFTYNGPISGIGPAWQTACEHMPRLALEQAHRPAFERYDSRYNTTAHTGIVEIWLPIINA